MTTNTLQFLGLMRRAGKLCLGQSQVEEAVQKHRAALLLLTSDAGKDIHRKMELLAEESGVDLQILPGNREEVSHYVGRKNLAVLAVTDAGFAEALKRRLAEDRPDMAGAEEKEKIKVSRRIGV